MKKIFKGLSISLGVLGLSMALTSCGNEDNTVVDDGSTQYQIYLLASESGFEGSYEEWLNSIKGEDGKAIELQVISGVLSWRYTGTSTWTSLINLSDLAGEDGTNGTNGLTPHIGENGNWYIGETDTGVKASGTAGEDGTNGTNGLTPHIGENGNWYIGETDTGVKASGTAGEDGTNGLTPHIGENGNWYIGETDTGVKASGTAGETNKYTVTFDVNGGLMPEGAKTSITDIIQGSTITLPIPTRDGYVFEGWYTGNTVNDGKFYNFTPVHANLTLAAKWSEVMFEVKINVDNQVYEYDVPSGTKYVDLSKYNDEFYFMNFKNSKGDNIDLNSKIVENQEIYVIECQNKYSYINKFGVQQLRSKIEELYNYDSTVMGVTKFRIDAINSNINKYNHLEVKEILDELYAELKAIEKIENVKAYYLDQINLYAGLVKDDANLAKYNEITELYKERISSETVTENLASIYREVFEHLVIENIEYDYNKTLIYSYKYSVKTLPNVLYSIYEDSLLPLIDEYSTAVEGATLEKCKEALAKFINDCSNLEVKNYIITKDDLLENLKYYSGEYLKEELNQLKEIIEAVSSEDDCIKAYLKALEFNNNGGYKNMINAQFKSLYEEKCSDATEESKLELKRIYDEANEALKNIYIIDVIMWNDLIINSFANDYFMKIQEVYVQDETIAIANKKAYLNEEVNEQYQNLINNISEDSIYLLDEVKEALISQIEASTTIEELDKIDVNNSFYIVEMRIDLIDNLNSTHDYYLQYAEEVALYDELKESLLTEIKMASEDDLYNLRGKIDNDYQLLSEQIRVELEINDYAADIMRRYPEVDPSLQTLVSKLIDELFSFTNIEDIYNFQWMVRMDELITSPEEDFETRRSNMLDILEQIYNSYQMDYPDYLEEITNVYEQLQLEISYATSSLDLPDEVEIEEKFSSIII